MRRPRGFRIPRKLHGILGFHGTGRPGRNGCVESRGFRSSRSGMRPPLSPDCRDRSTSPKAQPIQRLGAVSPELQPSSRPPPERAASGATPRKSRARFTEFHPLRAGRIALPRSLWALPWADESSPRGVGYRPYGAWSPVETYRASTPKVGSTHGGINPGSRSVNRSASPTRFWAPTVDGPYLSPALLHRQSDRSEPPEPTLRRPGPGKAVNSGSWAGGGYGRSEGAQGPAGSTRTKPTSMYWPPPV